MEDTYRPPPPEAAVGTRMVPEIDGSYTVLDFDGTPLGSWQWEEEEEEWVYFPFWPIPIIALPFTGDMHRDSSGLKPHQLLFMLSFVFPCGAVALHINDKKKDHGKYEKRSMLDR